MAHPMRVLDLFSGIGGFALGLERAGMDTTAFCEIKPHSRAVLAKHWPGVPCYHDITTLTGDQLARDGLTFDVICGGFPCQDISAAGRGEGIEGSRSGLWSHYARLIGEVRPRWVIIENSPMLRTRGADRVLGDLEREGYACWPVVVGAVHAGAPHKRQRAFVLAHTDRDNGGSRRSGRLDPGSARQQESERALQRSNPSRAGATQWSIEPAVGRMAHGVPSRVDRIAALGNAVVPQVVEAIGRAILTTERDVLNDHRNCRL